jgi:hypothetical protein
VPGRPGEARDRVFGAVGESLRVGGHDLGAASPKNEVLRSDQKVSYLDHFSLQHVHLVRHLLPSNKSVPPDIHLKLIAQLKRA